MRSLLNGILLLCGLLAFSQKQHQQITVYFDSDLSTLKVSEIQKLQSFFSDQNQAVLAVAIVGYCDDIGSNEDNLVLSMKRAKAIENYLNTTFDINAVTVTAKGEIALSKTEILNSEMARKMNRKTVIDIDYMDSKSIAETTLVKDPIDQYEGYKTIADPLAIGDKIILRHILFIGGRTIFEDQEEADAELETLVAYFAKNPNIQFAINGHVCCITNSFWDARDLDTGKNNLSETRAKKIFDYFVAKGIDPFRMEHKGYGRKFPRENVSEQLNKRVEIVILKI
ncbi:MAG: OmpA family protein [Flavobacterium sp.]|nr:OmpA family protein [Flavobacterium sp.]